MALSSTSSAQATLVVVKPQEITYVERSIEWNAESLTFAANALEPQRASVEALLETMSKGANSMTVARDSGTFVPKGPSVSNYPYFEHYNHPIYIETFTDWGTNVTQFTWAPDDQSDMLQILATLPEGTCKFSWSLFNVSTWFAPDCAPRVASPETYLRTALIQWIDNVPTSGDGLSFDEFESLLDISERRLPYTVENGHLYSDRLYEYMRVDGIALVNDRGSHGWEISIDPTDPWNITLKYWSDIQTAQDLADLGHVETHGDESWVSFRK
jgi:hypothetical protein